MDRETLRRHLTAITPHERDYQKGIPSSLMNIYQTIIVDGKEVLVLALTESLRKDKGPLFGVKRHSRFQTFPLHCHDFIELNYMYSGSCQQIINNETHKLLQGQLLLMDANTIHTIEPLGEDDILINVFISKEYLSTNFFNRFSSESVLTTFFMDSITNGMKHDNYLLFHSENDHRLHLFMEEFLCEWHDPSIVFRDVTESLLNLIISELVIVYKNDYTNSSDRLRKTPIIPILRYIEENYKDCSLTQTASVFNLNPNYLSNLLKKHTGYSYIELVLDQRLKSAEQLLLASNLGITEISQSIGCENVSFFYKKFQKKFGILPGEYRKKFQIGSDNKKEN